MNELNTPMCPQRVHKLSITLLIITSALLISCSNDSSKRPSPLTADSLRTENNFMYIIYSSPAVRGRKIWGELDPFGKVWRIGANEATIFYSDKDLILLDSIFLPKGKYALFAIPRADEWTIIFNKEWNQWGAYDYNEDNDQVRFDLTPKTVDNIQERLTFDITEDALSFSWEYLTFSIPYKVQE